MANFLFYLMAAGAVAAALGVVLSRNPISSILSLLASFFCLAAIYLLAGFQFIAATQILVYAGAIMVLFLFVIMLLNLGNPRPLEPIDARMLKRRKSAVTLAISGALLVLISSAFFTGESFAKLGEPAAGGIDQLGPMADSMFGRFILPFEATSLLLLVTAVAVLVLAKRDRGPRTPSPASRAPGGERT